MATTFIDLSIIKNFSSIFTFIFIFVLIYGLLELFQVFGEGKKGIHAIIAMVLGFLVSINQGVITVIQTFTPWFMILVLLIFFILFAVRMFGVSSDSITQAFHNKGAILTWIIIFTVLILLFSLGAGFGQQTLDQSQTGGTVVSQTTGNVTAPTNTGSFSQNLYNTIYHPKILGMVLVMLVVVISMLLLTEPEGP